MMYVFLIWNVFTFLLFGFDKYCAIHDHWRISEKALFLCSLLYGSLGSLVGMFMFHHKTRKLSFRLLIPLFFLLQIASLYILFKIA